MTKLLLAALLLVAPAAFAQTSSTSASGTALGNMQGNNQGVTQAIIFDSPASSTSNINYSGSQTIKNVPSVNGPNLTTSNDTCMGSSSAAANGPGIGLSFGTTWTDDQCKRLKMSRELWNKGMKAASLAMDCMDPAAMAALEMTGTRCPQSMTPQERISAFGPAPQQQQQQQQQVGSAPAVAPVAAAPVVPAARVAPAASRPVASTPAVASAPASASGTTSASSAPSAGTAEPAPAASPARSSAAKPRYAMRSSSVEPIDEADLIGATDMKRAPAARRDPQYAAAAVQ